MTELTREQKIAELEKRKREAREDPAAFINYFCWTFNPRVAPYHFPFKLFPFQEERIVRNAVAAIDNGEDVFFDKTRDMGATYTLIAVLLWYWLYVPGSNFLLGSRKQDLVDNTRGDALSNKEESLFGKLDYIIGRLPAFMLPKGFSMAKNRTFMSLVNPENGNVISGESSNPNFSRGGRYKAVLMDEFAFWDNDSAAWGSTGDTTNCRIPLTTPGIRPSKAKRLRFGKDGEKIKIVELPYHLDPRKDAAWLNREKLRRSAEDFAREIMMNWDVSVVGRVYPEVEHVRMGDFPYMPDQPLYCSWDFGLDGTPIQWWQKNPANGLWRLVDSTKVEDKPIQYLFPLFPGNLVETVFEYSSEMLEMIREKVLWKKAIHFGDPDVAKRSLVSKEVTSTRKELEKAGIYVQTSPASNDFPTRREKTKLFLQNGVEVNNTPGNDIFVESVKQARYPQRSENSQATTPVVLPIHDWTSHHRTALEYFAVNIGDGAETEDDYSKYENYPQEA
jgi:hypothetical protein